MGIFQESVTVRLFGLRGSAAAVTKILPEVKEIFERKTFTSVLEDDY